MSRRALAVLLIVLLLVVAAFFVSGEFSGQPVAVGSSFLPIRTLVEDSDDGGRG
jgi:hypothetical protein